MSDTPRRKLIEVALPLEAINTEAGRRKRKAPAGYPTGLHKWWAQRPLAACRAVLLASLLDDPSSDVERFPTEELQDAERERLFHLIQEAVRWDRSTDDVLWRALRDEVAQYHEGATAVDPFAGGGSIPLEAQRLGLSVAAFDLNPVAVLVTKALTELPWVNRDAPAIAGGDLLMNELRGVSALAADIRVLGQRLVAGVEEQIRSLFPRADDGVLEPVAWLWCRTVQCPNPACRGEAPLLKTTTVSTKNGKTWLAPTVDKTRRRVSWRVEHGGTPAVSGTVTRRGARCLLCGEAIPFAHIRKEGQARGLPPRLLCVVAQDGRRRVYLNPSDEEEQQALGYEPPADTPATELPEQALGFRVRAYGFTKHTDLFSSRQLHVLVALSSGLVDLRKQLAQDGVDHAYGDAVVTYLAFAISRVADYGNCFASWRAKDNAMRSLFSQQSVPMVWDYAEANPLGPSSGGVLAAIEVIAKCVETLPASAPAEVEQRDAASLALPADALVCTDPPYYDNIGYADLSDFFYVWLRTSLKDIYPDLFATLLSPKAEELVATPFRFGGDKDQAHRFFETGFREAFARARGAQRADLPMTVFYAYKQAETEDDADGSEYVASTGWETMLEGLIQAGHMITGTWPMRTEGDNRQIGVGANALASSIVLVCRPRAADAPLATRREFTEALRAELPEALRDLQHSNIAPVDLAQASIGPGMAIFTRNRQVVETDGTPMSVRDALALINQVLDELLASQEADFEPSTRWAIAWFEQFGMTEGPFGVAETLSRAKNTALNTLSHAGLVSSRGGKVRLLNRNELGDTARLEADTRMTAWEATQLLIRFHQTDGEEAAAEFLREVGSGRSAIARELAYRLFAICERKGWAQEALAYNAIVTAWPEITRLAAHATSVEPAQETLEV